MIQQYVTSKGITDIKYWSTKLYSKIKSCGVASVYRWNKEPITDFIKIIIPINFDNCHWALCTILPVEKKMQYFDSYKTLSSYSETVFEEVNSKS